MEANPDAAELIKSAKKFVNNTNISGANIVVAATINASTGEKNVLASIVNTKDDDASGSDSAESESDEKPTTPNGDPELARLRAAMPGSGHTGRLETVQAVMSVLEVDARDLLDPEARNHLSRMVSSSSEHLVNVVAGTLRSVGNKNRLNYLAARFRALVDIPLEQSTTRVFDSLLESATHAMPTRRTSRYSSNSGVRTPRSHGSHGSHGTGGGGERPLNAWGSEAGDRRAAHPDRALSVLSEASFAGDSESHTHLAELFRQMHGVLPDEAEPDLRFTKTYWVSEYRTRMGDAESDVDRLAAFGRLCSEFSDVAVEYAKIIVSERSVEYTERTIKPVSLQGDRGENFLCAGIYMRYAIDLHGIYDGDDEMACKAARQDLRNMEHLHTVVLTNWDQLNHVRLPLVCMVDYKGMSVYCTSFLPLDQCKLVYGSVDGGSQIHNTDRPAAKSMEFIASKLNLKEHQCGTVQMCLSGDIQVYRDPDSNYLYLLDAARIFPCEPPSTGQGDFASSTTTFLRGETVKRWNKPMCSDAHTAWDDSNLEERTYHNNVVRSAFSDLLRLRIPAVAHRIDELDPNGGADLSLLLHTNGVCIRHLKVVLKHLKSEHWKSMVVTEMAARALKSVVKSLFALETNSRNTVVPTECHHVRLYGVVLRSLLQRNANERVWLEFSDAFDSKFIVGDVMAAPEPEQLVWDVLLCRLVSLLGIPTHAPFLGIKFGEVPSPRIDCAPYFADSSPLLDNMHRLGVMKHTFSLGVVEVVGIQKAMRLASTKFKAPLKADDLAGLMPDLTESVVVMRRCHVWVRLIGVEMPLSFARLALAKVALLHPGTPEAELARTLTEVVRLREEGLDLLAQLIGPLAGVADKHCPQMAAWWAVDRVVLTRGLGLSGHVQNHKNEWEKLDRVAKSLFE